ncbi:hypothetical protein Agabi119p4_10621 [Agaricus bisporus var. burnettii]|uniref:Cytochrome P450 n=1 Tax=Agaricus bisporus var. burnettii TaxID=192524 RepID=A0A8H7C2Q0_AGABI|nr:hypothetical protein Agabi119p4_10621 [Agaricus bisporus var. burnettii]
MPSLSNADICILAGLVFGAWFAHGYIQKRRENPNNLPLPPGPKSYPIIGSFFSAPTYKAWLEYDKWFKIYGDMVYFKVFGQGFLILGSHERIYDIFERRSSNYSDRPRLVMLNEMMGWDYVFAFQRYGTWWRRHRRQFHDHFHPNVVNKYHPIQIGSARVFVRNLLESPEKFRYHIRYALADSILKATYGMDVEENESYAPSYLWNSVKERMEAGTAKPCIATAMLEDLLDDDSAESKEEETVRRGACANGFLGGADTTVSKRRLNSISLPYVNALLKESERWQPVFPLAIAHMSSNADEYDGYYIPKSTYVIGNAWSILHDPEFYKDPLVFNPGRFLKDGEIDPSVRDPNVASFGFGRRICPGRFFADASLYSTVTHVLTVFDIKPNLDENGKEIEIKPDMTDGLLSYPEAFQCRIVPRSKEGEQLIRNSGLV